MDDNVPNLASRLNLVMGMVAVVLICGGLPIYQFFFHCPTSDSISSAAKRLRIGMSYEEAWAAMPLGTHDVPDRRLDARGWSGSLMAIDVTSTQCECRLDVRVEHGVVTKIDAYKYNDLDHGTSPIR